MIILNYMDKAGNYTKEIKVPLHKHLCKYIDIYEFIYVCICT